MALSGGEVWEGIRASTDGITELYGGIEHDDIVVIPFGEHTQWDEFEPIVLSDRHRLRPKNGFDREGPRGPADQEVRDYADQVLFAGEDREVAVIVRTGYGEDFDALDDRMHAIKQALGAESAGTDRHIHTYGCVDPDGKLFLAKSTPSLGKQKLQWTDVNHRMFNNGVYEQLDPEAEERRARQWKQAVETDDLGFLAVGVAGPGWEPYPEGSRAIRENRAMQPSQQVDAARNELEMLNDPVIVPTEREGNARVLRQDLGDLVSHSPVVHTAVALHAAKDRELTRRLHETAQVAPESQRPALASAAAYALAAQGAQTAVVVGMMIEAEDYAAPRHFKSAIEDSLEDPAAIDRYQSVMDGRMQTLLTELDGAHEENQVAVSAAEDRAGVSMASEFDAQEYAVATTPLLVPDAGPDTTVE